MEDISNLLNKDLLLAEIESRDAQVEDTEVDYKEYFRAARTIQRCVRGYIVRKHIQKLKRSAIIIQKHIRAFESRTEFYDLLSVRLCSYYCKMATCIQKSWRGYFSRKAKFSYQGLQCWLAQIKTENCHIAKKSHQFLVESEESCLSSKRRYLDEMCNRLHFLQRTRNIPGVFSNRHSTELSQIEKCLNSCRRFPKQSRKNQSINPFKTEEMRRKILQQSSLNKTNLRTTWEWLSKVPPMLEDSLAICRYTHRGPNRSKDTTRLRHETVIEDKKWRKRITMFEKRRLESC